MGWWPKVRAGLVAVHVAAMLLSAIPSPEGGLNRATWKDPTVQAEFAAWAGRFGMAPEAFEDAVWAFASRYGAAHKAVLKPVVVYEDLLGTGQSWKMFVAPHKFPTRLEIAGRPADGEWRVLYYESSPSDRWRAGLLGLERLRSAIFRWGWPNYPRSWAQGCSALATLAFGDFPDLAEVRCRFWKAKSPSPDEARTGNLPPGRWVSGRLVKKGPDGVPLPVEKIPDEAETTTGAGQ